jgi:hypothetical protein
LPKSHIIDACVIVSQGEAFDWALWYFKKRHVAKGDYQLTRGSRGEQKIPTGKIHGFRKFDKVKYLGKEYFIKGRMNSGFATLMDISGTKAAFGDVPRGQKTPQMVS